MSPDLLETGDMDNNVHPGNTIRLAGTEASFAKLSEPTPTQARALELVNLTDDVVAKPIRTLSGGQFQRLLLAFAFLGGPRVLLFDEPTAGIDEPAEERLYERIDRLRAERHLTLLVISHELSFVYRHATHVLGLGRGWELLRGAGRGIDETETRGAVRRSNEIPRPRMMPGPGELLLSLGMATAAGLVGCFGRHGHHHDDGKRGKGDERQESIAQKACHGPTSFRVLVSISLKLMDSFLGEGV